VPRGWRVADIRIFTSRSCGWAIRNYASLLEKGIAFDTVPAVNGNGNKTDEFIAATPFLLTPVLAHGETRVFESTVINEYVNDRFPDPPLLPPDPAGRVEARKWIHFSESRLLSTLTKIARTEDSLTQRSAIDSFNADMNWLAENVLGDDWHGPYLFGELFSLTDIAFSTVFETVRSMENSLDISIAEYRLSIEVWQRNIAERPSIQQAIQIREQISY
jgi:glutathione S-transferase